jgi:small subunit ribosomal protein S27Ae
MADKAKAGAEGKAKTSKATKYDLSAGLKRKGKFCPKCGAGVFMAEHKDRSTCGKCGTTEKKNRA